MYLLIKITIYFFAFDVKEIFKKNNSFAIFLWLNFLLCINARAIVSL